MIVWLFLNVALENTWLQRYFPPKFIFIWQPTVSRKHRHQHICNFGVLVWNRTSPKFANFLFARSGPSKCQIHFATNRCKLSFSKENANLLSVLYIYQETKLPGSITNQQSGNWGCWVKLLSQELAGKFFSLPLLPLVEDGGVVGPQIYKKKILTLANLSIIHGNQT